jgi:hypothetical protein
VGIYFATLSLTILVETFVALALAPDRRRDLLVAIPLLNLLTHPLATLAVQDAGMDLMVVEVVVTLVEGAGYVLLTGLGWRRAVWISVAANGTTTAIALLWRFA